MIGVAWKIVLHTTESDGYSPSSDSYPQGHQYWPHATITDTNIFQHLPIDRSVYALARTGATATNGANAIQCEIVWHAANPDWPDALLANVVLWIKWVQAQTGVPTNFAELFREGVTVASVSSPIRFADQQWLDFSGICGHSNVPGGNDHWDPGRLPVARLQAMLQGDDDLTPDQAQMLKELHDLFLKPVADVGAGVPWGVNETLTTVRQLQVDVAEIKAKLAVPPPAVP